MEPPVTFPLTAVSSKSGNSVDGLLGTVDLSGHESRPVHRAFRIYRVGLLSGPPKGPGSDYTPGALPTRAPEVSVARPAPASSLPARTLAPGPGPREPDQTGQCTQVRPPSAGSLRASHPWPLSLLSVLPLLPRCALSLGCRSFGHHMAVAVLRLQSGSSAAPPQSQEPVLPPWSQHAAAPPARRCPAAGATRGSHARNFRFASSHLSRKIVPTGTQHKNYE